MESDPKTSHPTGGFLYSGTKASHWVLLPYRFRSDRKSLRPRNRSDPNPRRGVQERAQGGPGGEEKGAVDGGGEYGVGLK